MSIIIQDLDSYLLSLLDLPDLIALMKISHYYFDKIQQIKIVNEWKDLNRKIFSREKIFSMACKRGYLIYAKWLLDKYKFDIHADNETIFGWACKKGHFDISKWLIDLGENHGYGRINLHADFGDTFRITCQNGYFEIAKWLVDLGENHGYGRIDIHGNHEDSFRCCCAKGYIEIVKWLIDLGENNGYGRIALRGLYIERNHKVISDYLDDLVINHGY